MFRRNLTAAGLGLAFLLLYGITACRGIYLGDSGEFVNAATNLAIAHPPGYPLYCLVGRIVSLLPAGEVALRLNLFSALCGACSVALLFLLGRRLAPLAGAAAAALFFGLAPLLWSQSVVAEIYAPHLLLFLASLLFLTKSGSYRAACAGAYLSALALVSHPTSLVLLPLLLYRLVRTKRAILPATILFLVGLTVVLYLPVRSSLDPFPDWGDPETPASMFAHLMRRQYAGVIHPDRTPGFFAREISVLSGVLFRNNMPVFLLPLLPIGAAVLLRRRRRAGAALLLGIAALVPALAIFLAFPLAPERVEENAVFFLPALALLHLLTAPAFGAFLRAARRLPRAPVAAGILVALLALLRLVSLLPSHRYDRVALPESYAREVLRPLPRGALLDVHGDDILFPLLYLREVAHLRGDVAIWNRGGTVYGDAGSGEGTPARRYATFPRDDLVPRGLLYAPRDDHAVPAALDDPLDPDDTWAVIVSTEPLRSLWINYEEMQARSAAAAAHGVCGGGLEEAALHRWRALRLSSPVLRLHRGEGLRYAKATLFVDRGELREAAATLGYPAGELPADVPGRLLLAEVLLRSGRGDEAASLIDPAMEGAPELLARAGAALLLAGNVDRGEALLRRAARQDGSDPDPLRYLQRLEEKRGDRREVVDLGRRALEIDPLLDDVRLRVARAHDALGNRDEARREFGRLLAGDGEGEEAAEARNWFESEGLSPPAPPGRR